MSTASYHAHRAAGRCVQCAVRPPLSGQVRCAMCQAKVRNAMRRHRHLPEERPAPRCGILVGCCGTWHNADTIPWTAPCCGRVYFAPTPAGAANAS